MAPSRSERAQQEVDSGIIAKPYLEAEHAEGGLARNGVGDGQTV
jgi:hypothetical protein